MKVEYGKIQELSQMVAEALGEGPDEKRRLAQENDLLKALEAKTDPRRKMVWALSGCTMLLLFGLAFALFFIDKRSASLEFWVGHEIEVGTQGKWLHAESKTFLPVRFADGSQVTIHEDSSGRVMESNRERVLVVLDKGRLTANIQRKKKKTKRWAIEAGEFSVEAIGTRFEVSWDPSELILDVSVSQGRVLVKGPGAQMEKNGVLVEKGRHLRVNSKEKKALSWLKDKEDSLTQRSALEEKDRENVQMEREEGSRLYEEGGKRKEAGKRFRRSDGPDRTEKSLPTKPDSWESLYDKGRYLEVFLTVQEEGLDQVIGLLDETKLWKLSEAARFAGKTSAAEKALVALRKRFPHGKRAALAAFLLGRAEMDLKGSPEKAVLWFEIYLKEAPNGPISEEALGRLMSAYQQAGKPKQAKKTAKKYLLLYPDGAFCKQAKSITGIDNLR